MHDKFKKRLQGSRGSERLRQQIAVEAARRMLDSIGPGSEDLTGRIGEARESEYYTAKRKAAAVLGHRIRPGDLPSDSEIRTELLALSRSRRSLDQPEAPQPEPTGPLPTLADHLDRFALYRLRLAPLESVKQNPKHHPEGDALYHALQVFELAREARPYDEDFLLAALLHDVGRAIDPHDHVTAAVEVLRGAVSERTLWLIEHHADLPGVRKTGSTTRTRKWTEPIELLDDLKLLREIDDSGRLPGAMVGTVDEALAYLKGLENEEYLT
jgi:hypothetical protein